MAMASSKSFSPVSNHRHSSLSQSLSMFASGPFAGSIPSGSTAASFAPSLSTLAVAAAGDTLRPAFLEESALSPEEYRAYVPALLSLKQSPAGIDGLFDELHALQYLRDVCKLELKDEVLILALFERTPLGIKPGHFYAWLRLTSWVQQGKQPSKNLLFTQTQPAQTFLGAPSTYHTSHQAGNSVTTPTTRSQLSAHPLSESAHVRSTGQATSKPPTSYGTLASPGQAKAGAKLIKPRARLATRSIDTRLHTMPEAHTHVRQEFSTAHLPSLGEAVVQEEPRSRSARPPDPALTVHPAPLDQSLQTTLHHAGPQMKAQILPSTSPSLSMSKIPLDTLLGFEPAPNPFKTTKPRIVRPTPVVASRRVTSQTFQDRERYEARSPSLPGWPVDESQMPLNWKINDRLGTYASNRAPISPLIQAGLDAASEVQKAKQALPPKTYTTIQRSSGLSPSKPVKPTKVGSSSKPKIIKNQRPPLDSRIVAPQPRRPQATGVDLGQAQGSKSNPYLRDEEEVHSMRSVKSGKSKKSHMAGRVNPSMSPIGDLLDSHLASLGAGGRPKSRSSRTMSKRVDDLHESVIGSSMGSIPHWLRQQDAVQGEASPEDDNVRIPSGSHQGDTGSIVRIDSPLAESVSASTINLSEDDRDISDPVHITRPSNPFRV